MSPRLVVFASLIALSATAAAVAAPVVVGNGGNVTVPDGDIVLPPSGDTTVQYVSTNKGISGVGANPDGSSFDPKNGSTYTTGTFMPGPGGSLSFAFDYISSDGTASQGSFPDNSWVDLVDLKTGAITELYTSTTTTTPLSGGTTASVLGSWSGLCYGPGCGNSGWTRVGYSFTDDDSYYLEFGVVNSRDEYYDSALYFDGEEVDGMSLAPLPEPASLRVLGLATAGLLGWRRLRRRG